MEDRYIKIGSVNIRYWDLGSGPPVLLIHGLGASVEWWHYNIEALSRSYQVFAVDLPGFGRSDKSMREVSVLAATRFLCDFMDEFSLGKARVIGRSMGGLISLQFALHHPERVSHLVLVDSAGLGRQVGLIIRSMSVPVLGEILTIPTRFSFRLVLNGLFYNKHHTTAEFVDLLYQMRNLPGARKALLAATRSGVNFLGQRDGIILLNQLASLKAPTLIVWGAQDRTIPVSHAYAAHKAFPGSLLYIFDRCGHCPQIEKAEDFNQVVAKFLSGDRPDH